MKTPGKNIKALNRAKDTFLKVFLIISIAFSILVISNCDFLTNFIDDLNGGSGNPPPEFGGSESGSYVTSLLKSVASGAAGQIGGSAASWAMSALGLSNGSPDYSDQLGKIDQDLQEIIGQLNNIQTELTNIDNDLKDINCSEWASSLKDEKSRVTSLLTDYHTYVATASDSGIVKDSVINDWVNQVLAIGSYSGKESMGDILTAFSTQLIAGASSGVIPACIQAISYNPPDNSFGTDTIYYNKVKLYTNYYYSYQVQALFLYNEARHYQAWKAAGSPNSAYLSADSVSYVCSNPNATLYCNEAAGRTNNLYNALISQFTTAGAPFTDENFVLMYNRNNPYLWPKSLEDFTTAAGDNCTDPLTSSKPCGITAGFYDDQSMGGVVYKGYTGWLKAGKTLLQYLLAGWSSGTAGNYLQSKLGFKNMKNKVIINSNTVNIELNETYSQQTVIPFFDTDWDYNFLPGGGGPALTEIQFREGPLTKSRPSHGSCHTFYTLYYIDYNKNSKVPSNRNSFYDAKGELHYCTYGSVTQQFSWSVLPGYLAKNNGKTNHEASARQYRWPVLEVKNLDSTENRTCRNTGGVWTMCGDDFTAYLDYNVPRPETCDNHASGVTCIITSEAVASANKVFGDNPKGQKRL